MIDKTKKIGNILNQQELDHARKGAKNVLRGRSFHQILNESVGQHSNNSITELKAQHHQSVISQNTTSDAEYEKIIKVVFRHEGKGFVKEDAGKESSKFGILEGTAREYGYKGDLESMTKEDAEKIYKKLWDKSGAGLLPYPLSLVHFDTYVNSPSAARRLLAKSQGDAEAYLSLRQERYNRLAELRPERFSRYMKGWTNRINNLRALVAEDRSNSSLASNPFQVNNVASSSSPINWNKTLF